MRLLAFIFALVILSSPANAEKRVALVIGNATYKNAATLQNPKNDAMDVAQVLQRLGFETIVGLDLDKSSMEEKEIAFSRAAHDADVALVYYSGHAMQFGGTNYLMPVDAALHDQADLRRLTPVDDVVADLKQAKNLRILVLDSCRVNPLAEELSRSIELTRGPPVDRGLARIIPPSGMIISYATQAGRTAADGRGRNSPYTMAFLENIETTEEIGAVFRHITAEVYNATQSKQLPELSLSLIGDFYLKGQPEPAASAARVDNAPIPATPASVQTTGEAAQVWTVMQNTTSIAVLEDFIRQFGATPYGSLARARLDELKKQVSTAQEADRAKAAAEANAAQAVRAKAEQGAMAAPVASPSSTPSYVPISKAEVVNLFTPFAKAIEQVKKSYVEEPDEQSLLVGALQGMLKAFPSAQRLAFAGTVSELSSSGTAKTGKIDLDSVYNAAVDVLNDRNASVDRARLLQAAFDGMLSGFDPHSSYMDANWFGNSQVQTKGEFGGLGIEVTMKDELLKVVTPIDDTPAAKAGIRAGDIITDIDGEAVKGLTLIQATGKMRGPVKSTVRLKVTRQGLDTPFEVTIIRDVIRIRSVRSEPMEDVGYIRITQFNEQTDNALKKAIGDLQTQIPSGRLKGYILDLRNNSDGLLDQAIKAADTFLESGEIVSTRGRNPQQIQRFLANPGDLTSGKPLIVLINGGTASGSEILAGALQDHKRATLVGTRSFGSGSVQTIFPLGADSGALRLTTDRYFTPSGRSIQAQGISPDVEVLQDVPEERKAGAETKGEASLAGHLKSAGPETIESQSYVPPDKKDDKAIRTALDLLHRTNDAAKPSGAN